MANAEIPRLHPRYRSTAPHGLGMTGRGAIFAAMTEGDGVRVLVLDSWIADGSAWLKVVPDDSPRESGVDLGVICDEAS